MSGRCTETEPTSPRGGFPPVGQSQWLKSQGIDDCIMHRSHKHQRELAGLAEASQRTDGACAGVGGEGVRDAEAQLWVQPCPLPWTGSKRHGDVVQADGLQPEEGGQVVWMLGLKPDDGGTATGTAPPEKRKASPRPPGRGQKLPFRTGNLTPRAAPELFKGPHQGGRDHSPFTVIAMKIHFHPLMRPPPPVIPDTGPHYPSFRGAERRGI